MFTGLRSSSVVLLAVSLPAAAQWLHYPTPGIPRTPDGKPNLSAPAPRAPNGKPDLSGLWQAEPASKYFLNILSDFKSENAPIRPEATVPRRKTNPCLPSGFLFAQLIDAGFKVIQTPEEIVILYAAWNFRQIYMDGRKSPADPQPLWWGYSVGMWEGNTLVVDTTGFNDKTSFDASGHPHSDALHLIERFRRRDFGHLEVEITIDDPKIYTKPLTIRLTELFLPDSDVSEYVCEENEKDLKHMGK